MKVGLAVDLRKRLAEFQLGNPHPIWLDAYRTVPRPFARFVEAETHKALSEFARGREWFVVDTRSATKAAHPFIQQAWRAVAKMGNRGASWEMPPNVIELRCKNNRL